MKNQFNLKNWLSENRNVVIEKYNKLTSEKFFQGITLKDFMLEVLATMERNNVKSEKTANSKLPFLMGNVYFENSNPSKNVTNKYAY